jgi:hypothetical protein
MAHAMERLLATPKTIPVFPASIDMVLMGWVARWFTGNAYPE